MPPHVPEYPFGESFKADNDTQAGILSQFVEFSTADPALNGEQLLVGIREAMSPMQLVHPDIIKKLPIYQKIRLFLERYSIDTPITEESGNLVARRLICRIWNSNGYATERLAALQMFDAVRSGAQMSPISSPIGSASIMQDVFASPRNERGSADNNRNAIGQNTTRFLAGAFAKRFSSDSSKFSGQTDECWDKYLDNYTRAAREMELTNEQKVKFIHHILRDHALGFYKESLEDKVNSWGEILRLMGDEFNLEVKMEAVADRLRGLHISQYEDGERSEIEALRAMAKDIQILTPQAPRECRTDRHRRMTLQDATRGRAWALQIVSSTHSKKLTYQQLLHEFENALQQHTAHKDFTSKSDSDGAISYRKGRVSTTHFAGQGRYGRIPGSKYKQPSSSTGSSTKEVIITCWNCGKPGCSVGKCSIPKDPERIKKNRIKYFEARNGKKLDKRVQEALFEFSSLLDSQEYDADPNGSASDEEIAQLEEDDKMAGIHHALIHTRMEHGLKSIVDADDEPGDTDF